MPELVTLDKHSVHHDQVAHAPAVYTALTGIRSNFKGLMGAKPTDHPAIEYQARPATDPVFEMNRKLREGSMRLRFERWVALPGEIS